MNARVDLTQEYNRVVGRCGSTYPKPVLKAPMVSTLESGS